jgi:hypothetical protein
MKTINIDTKYGLLRIQVIKNDFTDEYIDNFQRMLPLFPIRSQLVTQGACNQASYEDISSQTSQLIDIVQQLHDMNIGFPCSISAENMQGMGNTAQDLMNKMHRAFTTAHRCNDNIEPLRWSDKFESRFEIADSAQLEKMLWLTDQVNALVHEIEINLKTDRKKFDWRLLPNQIEIHLDSYVNNNTRMLKEWFHMIKPQHAQYYNDSKEFDVWVGKDILGKDYLVAYYEHDDPSEWDVSYSLGYSGKFAIDQLNDIRRVDILHSDEFRSWLDSAGVAYTPAICGMPIGTVTEGKELVNSLVDGLFTKEQNIINQITIE